MSHAAFLGVRHAVTPRKLPSYVEIMSGQPVSPDDQPAPRFDARAIDAGAEQTADDPGQPLPELLSDRYRIRRELGRGGMAHVYLATDIKHDRPVAVKVIRPELAASLGRVRFLREIAIAARLRHPNIVPLYDSGDVNGVLYFVMPYEDGQSLRQQIDGGRPIPANRIIAILRDVAKALAYAHANGVVHRDIKPDNVMLSGDTAVVTDFGIAKAVTAALDSSGNTTTLTRGGGGVGTPAYMAPEQAVGDPATDHRSDIYSFGCLAYELISGKPPFHDMPVHQLITAHVSLAPAPLTAMQGDVDAHLEQLVMRCLAKEPADRPQSAQELVSALDGAMSTTPERSGALVTATSPVAGRWRRPRGAALLIGGTVVAVAAAAWAVTHRPASLPQEVTVAVLPMESLGGDSVQVDLASGLSSEIAFELFRVPGVRVMSQRALGSYRGSRDIDPAQLGREFGARYLVLGTNREHAGKLQVRAKLLDATTGAVLWSNEFERDLHDYSGVRTAIALAVGDTLRRLLAPEVAARPVQGHAPRKVDPEAYRLYILAQRALDKRGLNVKSSVDNFSSAVAIDSNYAEAWGGLSLARALTPWFSDVSSRAIAAAVRDAAARAIRLDSTLAAPHVALGLVHFEAYRYDSAGVEYRTGVSLRAPTDVEPLVQYGRYFMQLGRPSDALEQFLLARQTEPASALVSAWTAEAFKRSGHLDSALVEIARAEQNDSTNFGTLIFGARIQLDAGRRDRARQLAARVPNAPDALNVRAALGDTAVVNAWLRKDDATIPKAWMSWTKRAHIMIGLGDTTAAMDALERAADATELPWNLAGDFTLSPLSRNPRYRRLVQRIGLDHVKVPPSNQR